MYYRKHLSRHFSPNLNKKRKSNNSFIKLFRGIVGISTIIAALFGFLTFQNIGNLNDLKDNIKEQPNSQMAINEWKDELDNVRIDYGRDYIENILGTPKLVKSINFNKSMYTECIYNNSYFTLFCYYNNSSSLTGF